MKTSVPLDEKGTKADLDLLAYHREHMFGTVMRESWGKELLKRSMFLKWLHDRDPNITDTVVRDKWNEEKETVAANGQFWLHIVVRQHSVHEIEIRHQKRVDAHTKDTTIKDINQCLEVRFSLEQGHVAFNDRIFERIGGGADLSNDELLFHDKKNN